MSQPVAFEINGSTVSRQRFYQVACDPRRSVAVEACAGAGKTWMLVSRMLRALLDGAPAQDILAITFTKKAAGEMRHRLQEWLLEFSRADDDALRTALRERGLAEEPSAQHLASLRGLHATLLRSGRSVQVRTFHSWFAALLRNAPLRVLDAMGLPSQYELLENDAPAIARVWRRFQDRVADDVGARADYMAAVQTYGRHQAYKALEAGLDKRIEFGLADAHGVVESSVAPFEQQFPEFAGLEKPMHRLHDVGVRAQLFDVAKLLGGSALVTLQQGATALEKALSEHSAEGILDALLTKATNRTIRKFSEKLDGIEVVRAAQALLLRTLQAQAQCDAWMHQQRMARLLRGLVNDYAQLKREQGWIDMSDLERAALTLLSDPVLSGWVQERLDAQVRHVLIDEFQDTNPLQWQALSAWLTGYAGAGNAPSVFIVGDPKQSIYRFRRAEPQVFKAAKHFVVQGLGGDVLSCDHTRRNAPAIIDAVNAVMDEAQHAGQFEGFRQHTTESSALGQVIALPRLTRDAVASDKSKNDGEAVWRDTLTAPRVVAEETLKTRECRQAALWLHQLLCDEKVGLQARDVMVLARKRERLALMQTELAALGIAAQQPEKADLCDAPEVQDIVALLDVLVSNNHDLALARALKSPLFAATDEDLMALAWCKRQWMQRMKNSQAAGDAAQPGGGGLESVTWWTLLHTQPNLPQRLIEASVCLQRWKKWVDSLPPHDALHAIYADADVVARMGAAAPPTMRLSVLANVRALLSAALSVDGGRYTTMYALVRALRAGGIAAPVRADAQAVRLLTVHGAKGLEAPLVLVLDADSESPRADSMGVLVQWPGEAAYPQRFVFLASESRPPACVVDALELEQAERRREELNTLYVALTRAQSTVVISCMEPHSPAPQSWWQRLLPHAQMAEISHATDQTGASNSASVPQAFTIKSLAPLSDKGRRAAASFAGQSAGDEASQDSLESRMGQAMHRFLEWVAPYAPGSAPSAWSEAQRGSVEHAFELTTEQAQQAQTMAWAILQGDAAWAWHLPSILWWSNEVPINVGGRVMRMDRLVQRADTLQWWVLDYKTSATPQTQPELRAQLLAYRDGVRRSGVEHTVRAAFLTAQGALIEIDSL